MRITLTGSQTLYFTSDTHYNHSNLCKATSKWEDTSNCRDFESLEAMNEALVSNINARVDRNDVLVHLGDVGFGGISNTYRFLELINCQNIYLLPGNHDYQLLRRLKQDEGKVSPPVKLIKKCVLLPIVEDGEVYSFFLNHFPIASWENMRHGVIHLHGHIHSPVGHILGPGRMMDVGVDGSPKFAPYSLSEVLQLTKDRPIAGIMHHGFDHHM